MEVGRPSLGIAGYPSPLGPEYAGASAILEATQSVSEKVDLLGSVDRCAMSNKHRPDSGSQRGKPDVILAIFEPAVPCAPPVSGTSIGYLYSTALLHWS